MINVQSFMLPLFLLLIVGAEQPYRPVMGIPQAESAEREEAAVKVSVFFATNRKRDTGQPTADTYSGERGEIEAPHFGSCETAFTPIPIIKRVAARVPFYLPVETSTVGVVEQTDASRFWQQLRAAVRQTSSGSVVVFVHGYNYSFERTCRMAAEMQRTLHSKAIVLMLSWPSNGRPTDYARDQADLEWSVPFVAGMLARLSDLIGPDNVQLMSHSLGARGVLLALLKLGAEREVRPLIGPLVLLAPDFDAQTFVYLLPTFRRLTGGITLYTSSLDTPLKVSHQLHGAPRLGQAGEFLTVIEGMETIDVSPAGRYQIMGHEYFYFHPLVAADLMVLLSSGSQAAERSGLRQKKLNGATYWQVVGDAMP